MPATQPHPASRRRCGCAKPVAARADLGNGGAMPSQYPEIVPVLTDGEVTLRALGPADVPALVEQGQDPQMVRWTTVPHPYGRDDAEAFLGLVERGWADDGNRVWAVEAGDGRGASRFAGTISCRPAGDGIAEVGFGLHPAARGRRSEEHTSELQSRSDLVCR